MNYEVTILVGVHPEAAFAGTDDEIENVYSLIESAVFDTDDLTLHTLEVLEVENG
jgi:hypothetical protein